MPYPTLSILQHHKLSLNLRLCQSLHCRPHCEKNSPHRAFARRSGNLPSPRPPPRQRPYQYNLQASEPSFFPSHNLPTQPKIEIPLRKFTPSAPQPLTLTTRVSPLQLPPRALSPLSNTIAMSMT